jgi:Xaa-Pro aminopeptidase
MSIFDHATIADRRRRTEQAFGTSSPLVLIAAGVPVPKPGGADQCYPFLPHPEYYWLTGFRRWGGILAFEAGRGWTHFVRPITAEEQLWEGGGDAPDGIDVEQFADWLKDRGDGAIAALGEPIPDVSGDEQLSQLSRERLDVVRRVKDRGEIDLVQRAVGATAAGFARAREMIRPGVTERAIQIEIEAEMFRHGADGLGYETIVGIGNRAGILHSTPGPVIAAAEDVVLIDAGGTILGYTADVTRTFPAGDHFTAEAQAIYDIVLTAEQAAIQRCQAGVEWHDVHRTAATELAAGLRHVGILRTSVDEALEGEAIALFFPHGVGHMVGLGVRDVGGRAPGREDEPMCCGARVRVDLPVRKGYLITVEPGIYFVPALLDDPERRRRFRDAVAWDQLDRWRKVGGIRIEDNVLVTDSGPQNITEEIPK